MNTPNTSSAPTGKRAILILLGLNLIASLGSLGYQVGATLFKSDWVAALTNGNEPVDIRQTTDTNKPSAPGDAQMDNDLDNKLQACKAQITKTEESMQDCISGVKSLHHDYDSLTRQLAGFQDTLTTISSAIIYLNSNGDDTIAKNRAMAASDMAKKSVESEDLGEDEKWNTAIVYAVNAVTNAPDNFEYYKQLNEIVLQMPQGDAQKLTLEQTIGILEMGMYKVDPQHVADLSEMVSKQHQLISNYSKQLIAESVSEPLPTLDFDNRWKEISDAKDIDKQLALCRKLNDDLNVLDTAGEDYDEKIRDLNSATEYLGCISTMYRMLDCAEAKLKAAKTEQDMRTIEGILQSVNGLVMQAWNYDAKVLPRHQEEDLTALTNRLLSDQKSLQGVSSLSDIQLIDDVLKDKPSTDARLTRIDNQFPIDGETIIKSDFKNQGAPKSVKIIHGKYTKEIMRLSRKAAKLNLLMQGVYAPDRLPEWYGEIDKINAAIKEAQQERTIAYQKNAVKRCHDSMQYYNGTKFFTNNDAIKIISEYLSPIETSLLLPETMEVYQSVRGICTSKLPADKRAKMEELLATTAKKSLLEL